MPLIERIYDHVENDRADRAVIACLRLAKNINDTMSVVMFLRELYPNRDQIERAFADETVGMGEDARKFAWEKTLDRWIEERSLGYSLVEEGDGKEVLALGVGELQKELDHFERTIGDFALPEGMGEYDTAAFTDKFVKAKAGFRMRMKANTTILERIRTRCLLYAARVEKQLATREVTTTLVDRIQIDVQNYYGARSDDVYQKLAKADNLLGSDQEEDHALLLAAVRRTLKAVADHHFPASTTPVLCADGEERILGDDKYLNRLHEFCARDLAPSGSTDLIKAELDYLALVVRRLNDVASKGVHANVTKDEAQLGLFALYLFLSAVIGKLTKGS